MEYIKANFYLIEHSWITGRFNFLLLFSFALKNRSFIKSPLEEIVFHTDKKIYDDFDQTNSHLVCITKSWIFWFLPQIVLSFEGCLMSVTLFASENSLLSWHEDDDISSSDERDRKPHFSRYKRAVSTYPAFSIARVIKTNISSVWARSMGKRPLPSTLAKFAHESISKLVILQWPAIIAKWSGVQPFMSLPSISAPWSRSNITSERLPSTQLCCKGVKPSLFLSLSAICFPPYFNKNFTFATSPSMIAWLKITFDADGQRESSFRTLWLSITLKINWFICDKTPNQSWGQRKSCINKTYAHNLFDFVSISWWMTWPQFRRIRYLRFIYIFGLIHLRKALGSRHILRGVEALTLNRSYWTFSFFTCLASDANMTVVTKSS